jgi:hypothetical protein
VGEAVGLRLTEEFSEAVDFCVHVLLVDGLRVAPFDQHLGGDHRLSAVGFEPMAWRAWMELVVDAATRLSASARQLGTIIAGRSGVSRVTEVEVEPVRSLRSQLRHPAALYDGTPELRSELRSVWQGYMEGPPRIDTLPRKSRAAIWREVVESSKARGDMTVFLVKYPVPVVMPIPPSVCVIARSQSAYGDQLRHAASALAHFSGSKGGA